MDVVVYGAEKVPPGFRVVKSAEELRRYLHKAFVVVGDERLTEELGVAYFTEEEWGDFLRYAGVHNFRAFRLVHAGGFSAGRVPAV